MQRLLALIGATKRSADPVILLLLVVSLAGNVYLVASRRSTTKIETTPIISRGENVPDLEAKTLAGVQLVVSYDRPTVIYAFSPECRWCKRNLAAFQQLAAAARNKYRVIALSLREFSAADPGHGYMVPGVEVLQSPSSKTTASYRLGPTPETIVVAAGGVIQASWAGAYGPGTREEIERYFHCSLPELEP